MMVTGGVMGGGWEVSQNIACMLMQGRLSFPLYHGRVFFPLFPQKTRTWISIIASLIRHVF